MKRRYEPTPDEDARALVRQLREECAHSMNLERTLEQLPAETRHALHTLTKEARAARIGDRGLAALLNG